jgi:hypothetical protein
MSDLEQMVGRQLLNQTIQRQVAHYIWERLDARSFPYMKLAYYVLSLYPSVDEDDLATAIALGVHQDQRVTVAREPDGELHIYSIPYANRKKQDKKHARPRARGLQWPEDEYHVDSEILSEAERYEGQAELMDHRSESMKIYYGYAHEWH